MSEFYANVLLKDGKIMFWRSGSLCNSPYDFYKDFYYAGLKMTDELATGRYRVVSHRIPYIGSKEDKDFYKQFPIHEESKGRKPYEV